VVPERVAGIDTHGLPGVLVEAIRAADAAGDEQEALILCEVVDRHREADNLAQRYLGGADPGPGESPDEYNARMRDMDAGFRAAHPEWLTAETLRDPTAFVRARALAALRLGMAAAQEAQALTDSPEFMERVAAVQPLLRAASAAAADFVEEAVAFTCPRCGSRSYNPNDIREGYCGACHDWTGGTQVCRAESGPYACVEDAGHLPPHRAGAVTWDDPYPFWQRVRDRLRRVR
jgi:predicted RNA-binding Zn-ribbon protein involved in translation (DUF1610 family)